jgi:tetratricopeptide (TPR) repeat protein
MNAESYLELLKQHANLYQLPYEALKTLAMQYPYSQSLQLLFLIKSEMEEHPDRQSQLQKTALYAPDRRKLRRLMKELTEKQPLNGENFHLKEEFLELKDLSAVAADLEKIALQIDTPAVVPPAALTVEPLTPPKTIEPSAPVVKEEPVLEFPKVLPSVAPPVPPPVPEPIVEQTPPLPPVEAPIAPPLAKSETAENNQALSEVLVTPPPTPVFKPLPKSAFSSWAKQTQPEPLKPDAPKWLDMRQLDEARERIKTKQDNNHGLASSEAEVIEFAQQSIQMKNTYVSETLAELLFNQEKYTKALAVYERLILLFPEKSARFAAKIDLIKNLLP